MRNSRGRALGVAMVAGLLTIGARDAAQKTAPGVGGLQEAEVTGMALDPDTRQPIVLLQGKRDKRSLVMTIGLFEANGIAVPLQGVSPPRPLTHDLMLTLLSDLNATLKRVVITDLKDDIYYARLELDVQGSALQVDSRPSDAIALALRAKVPILIEERVFDKTERLAPKASPSPHF
jgi:bifunctional DNase/RNase